MQREKLKAFTLIEAIVVVAIITIISVTALVTLGGNSNASEEMEAKGNLGNFLDIADNFYMQSGSIPAIGDITTVNTKVIFQTTATTSVNTLSYYLSGSIIAAASKSKTGCWYVIRNYAPTALSPALLWAFNSTVNTCLASDAILIVDPGTGKGYKAENPILS
jgi:type II secretory pathway pseudopilin PulG